MTTQPGGVGPVLDGSGHPYDQIALVGISATGYHGVFDHERRDGQVFRADVVVYLDTRRAAATDDLSLTVNYGLLATEVAAVLSGDPVNLIETVAERIAAVALAYPAVAVVDVSLHKPQAPVTVPFDDIVVTIRRDHHKLPAAEPRFAHADEAPAAASLGSSPAGFDLGAPESTPFATLAFEPAAGPAPATVDADAHGAAELSGNGHGQEKPRLVSEPVSDAASAAFAVEAFAAAVAAAVPAAAAVPPAAAVPAAAVAPPAAAASHSVVPLVEVADESPFSEFESLEHERQEHDRHERNRLERDRAERERLELAPPGPVEVVLALGSNVGAPQDTLRAAVVALGEVDGLEVLTVSPLARTASVGGPEQPDYLNAVVIARTTLAPRALLRATQAVEDAHGRQRNERWGPRTLDIDLIVYGTTLAVTDDLELPHPRAHQRAFVLQPWAQIAPDAVLPGLGGGPVGALAATAPDRGGIRWLALDWLTAPPITSPAPAPAPAPAAEGLDVDEAEADIDEAPLADDAPEQAAVVAEWVAVEPEPTVDWADDTADEPDLDAVATLDGTAFPTVEPTVRPDDEIVGQVSEPNDAEPNDPDANDANDAEPYDAEPDNAEPDDAEPNDAADAEPDAAKVDAAEPDEADAASPDAVERAAADPERATVERAAFVLAAAERAAAARAAALAAAVPSTSDAEPPATASGAHALPPFAWLPEPPSPTSEPVPDDRQL
ncbi:2-amino-4-hydroxy-6-hydroxymethyldihydropteridine diphosphokinase [Pengzhenrongella frigida]|uniref:2-amino-4-hydroxy-6- hydroxymethyldihydropteridine diphosphokinase n=1 Tax=Pengzhenrongella frigida TaxID=1259133 RepID=UPI001A92553C|nr:2-amino-4-hydroxy-6-hydroxymethyldihydropteridine diphosphokinase [Cellulomonas sp. HLT2-17]